MTRNWFLPALLLAVATWGATAHAESTAADPVRLQIARVRGDLDINGEASTPLYTVYFHVPIADESQIPLAIEISGGDLVEYRLLRTTGPNILAAARMRSDTSTTLSWLAWVLIDAQKFDDVPEAVPLPAPADLPDSTRPFLQATATAQVECAPIQIRASYMSGYQTVNSAAQAVCDYVHDIPGIGTHRPISFDAYYAMVWGSSCTGHAHAATALLRALGIPARTKLCFLTWYPDPLDMHWTTDYFVPGYGWVGMDATMGENPMLAQREVVVYCCDPADEFPLFYDHGIDCFWHTSDPGLPGRNPVWGSAHEAVGNVFVYLSPDDRDDLLDAARVAFDYEIETRGVQLPEDDAQSVATARIHVANARDNLSSGNVAGGLDEMALAVAEFQTLTRWPPVTRFETDFEEGPLGWAHGGVNDEWEFGTPGLPGPESALSGDFCWGTDLDGTYENWTNAWLLSPPIDLTGLRRAQLEFRVWNQTTGTVYDANPDRLTVEVVDEAGESVPLSGSILGGNDDPDIPVVGGWSRLDLDLTPHVGESVQIRFRFYANGEDVRAGTYLEDMKITGVGESASPVTDTPPSAGVLSRLRVYPNPFNPRTRVAFELGARTRVHALLYDLAGKRIATLADGWYDAGPQTLDWNGLDRADRAAPAGAYLLRIEAGGEVCSRKLMLVR